jgi:IS5 family transposase
MALSVRSCPGEGDGDRLSFRRFTGLPLDQGAPHHSTICWSRRELERLGLSAALFSGINRQLDARELIVRSASAAAPICG